MEHSVNSIKFVSMDLFSAHDELANLLPKDGTVNYYGHVLSIEKANYYFQELFNTIEWKHDSAMINGKQLFTDRKVAWYADKDYNYSYSGTTKKALVWTKELLELKDMVEDRTGVLFNLCLLNLYHNGEEGMAWHSDDEKSLGENTTIASLSLGAERKFAFKHKETKETISLFLNHGSLLVMKDETQTYWWHRIPPTKLIKRPRINLTFRTIVDQ